MSRSIHNNLKIKHDKIPVSIKTINLKMGIEQLHNDMYIKCTWTVTDIILA